MTKEEYEKLSEELKEDILREIAYEYAVFVPKGEGTAISKFKSIVSLSDKQFLDKNVTAEEVQIFPYNVIMGKLEKTVESYYREFRLGINAQELLAHYGDRGERFNTYFTDCLRESQSTTIDVVKQELFKQLCSKNDAKAAMKAVGEVIARRTQSLGKLLESLFRQMEQLTVLWEHQDSGYTKYRINAIGESCETCRSISGRIFNIADSQIGEMLPPLHPNCDCRIEILDDKENVVYTAEKAVKDEQEWGKYLLSSLKQLVLGDTLNFAKLLGNLGFLGWNWAEDQIWKCIALGVSAYGWQLTADLLWLAASGSGNTYTTENGSYASELLKNDSGLNRYIKDVIWLHGTSQNKSSIEIHNESYEIPLNNGDLGAALHNVNIDISAYRNEDDSWTATVKVSDTFDFTEFKNPFKQGTLLKGLLWAANDIAYFDTKWELLDSVKVDVMYQRNY